MITQNEFQSLKVWCAIVRERTNTTVKLALIGNFKEVIPVVKVGSKTLTGSDSKAVISQLKEFLE